MSNELDTALPNAPADTPPDAPLKLFLEWFAEAKEKEPSLPEAMSVATVDARGRPSSRMVLLKGADAEGFVFYTNFESRKGTEIKGNPHIALLFHWKNLERQVRIEGSAMPVSKEEADTYFASRERGAQIGAWASDQSRTIAGRFELEQSVARTTAKFATGTIPRPPHWNGFRLTPERYEFWSQGRFRLHRRIVYIRDGDSWRTERLFP